MEISELANRQTGFDQLEGFEAILDKIESSHKIISVPANKISFQALQQDQSLFKCVWNRLYQLGYLSTSKPPLRLRTNKTSGRRQYNKPKLTSALKAFQQEACIVNDGWLGLQTWTSLQQLYTFDDSTNLSHWLSSNRRAALQRSIELRLRVLGIVEDDKRTVRVHQVNRTSGIEDWKSFLLYLDVVPKDVGELELLTYLYDFDKLTPLLQEHYEKIQQSTFKFRHALLKSVLTIEMWLHGLEDIEPKMGLDGKAIQFNGDDPISKAVTKLCNNEELNAGPQSDHNDLIQVGLQFFSNFDIGELDANQSDKIVETINEISGNKKHAEALSKKISEKSWGAWLLDGIKRGFRWVHRQLQKGVQWIVEKIESLAIAIKKLSLPVVSFYRRTINILSDGISVFTDKLFKGSTQHYAIYRDCDFDFKVFIADSADASEVQQFLDGFNAIWVKVYKAISIALILVQVIKEGLTLASASLIGIPFIIARFYKFTCSTEYKFIKDAFSA